MSGQFEVIFKHHALAQSSFSHLLHCYIESFVPLEVWYLTLLYIDKCFISSCISPEVPASEDRNNDGAGSSGFYPF